MLGVITLCYWQVAILVFWDELTVAAQYIYSYVTAYHYYGMSIVEDYIKEYIV